MVLQDCLLCPTGFSANMAVMTALGSISSLLSHGKKPTEYERIAIFSDALNHASIIDGIRLLERQQEALVFVYKHCDMFHLDFLLYVSSSLCSSIQCIHTTWISCNYIFIISADPLAQWKRKLLSPIGKSSLTSVGVLLMLLVHACCYFIGLIILEPLFIYNNVQPIQHGWWFRSISWTCQITQKVWVSIGHRWC